MKTFPADKTLHPKIICVGLNYSDHAKEGNMAIPDFPVFFIRYPSSFVGPDEALVVPKVSDKFDYEVELTVVIGKRARHVKKENALDYVYGYTLANDGSVRDYQRRTQQWTLGKNFDKSASIGTHIVPAASLPAGAKGLRLTASINGTTLQDGNTSDMIFDVPTLIEALTEVMTLEPGDLILTGTPAGVGFARNPHVWMKPGDTVTVAIEGIGSLTNTVVAEA